MDKLEAELAKAAGQIAVDTAKDSRAAIGVLFGDAVREFGHALGDHARLYRFENLVRIMDKVERIRSERGYTPEQMKALPFGEALRVIEAASTEEEDDVQDLWARLIANASTPDSGKTVKKLYIDLLKSISPIEAAFLDLVWRFRRQNFLSLDELRSYNDVVNEAFDKRWRSYSEEDRHGAIQNLLRLRCITLRPQPIRTDNLLGRAPRELISSSGFNEWAFIDARKFGPFLEKIMDQIAIAGGAKEYTPKKGPPLRARLSFGLTIDAPELQYLLTSLGSDLMTACSIEGEAIEVSPDLDDPETSSAT